jgi:DNA-binding response OmpR family regulator
MIPIYSFSYIISEQNAVACILICYNAQKFGAWAPCLQVVFFSQVEFVKLLIVDSDTDLTSSIKDQFDSSVTVTIANNGAQAFSMLRMELPDAILLEWQLKDMSGKDVLTKLRSDARYEFTPILIYSEQVSDTTVYGAYQSGADEFIPKPVTVQQIINKAKVLIENQNFSKELINRQ